MLCWVVLGSCCIASLCSDAVFSFCPAVLGIRPRTLHIIGKCSVTQACHQPRFCLFVLFLFETGSCVAQPGFNLPSASISLNAGIIGMNHHTQKTVGSVFCIELMFVFIGTKKHPPPLFETGSLYVLLTGLEFTL